MNRIMRMVISLDEIRRRPETLAGRPPQDIIDTKLAVAAVSGALNAVPNTPEPVVAETSSPQPTPAQSRRLRVAEVMYLTGLSRSTLWRMEREGRFPKRHRKEGGHAVSWLASEIEEWVAAKA